MSSLLQDLMIDHATTQVYSIKRHSDIPSWTVRTDLGSENYKAVIIAAPIHSTGISLPSVISSQIPEQPYVHLHVTLLTTTSPQPSPEYFSLSPSSKVPSMILTTYEGVRKGGKEPEFNSLSYHGHATKGTDGVPDQWSVKIFSKERISDEWLDKVFMGQVGWVYRKEVGPLYDNVFVADQVILSVTSASGMHIHSFRQSPPSRQSS